MENNRNSAFRSAEAEQKANDLIHDTGDATIRSRNTGRNIHLLSIIGEIEGHDNLSSQSKATKYEHILPKLAMLSADDTIEGILILVNTTGGNVECGLAIAEMIASIGKPTVSIVIGDGHSIGVPIAVSADYTFIVPSASMMIHPVRTSGTLIGVIQSYRNIEKIQNRITGFIASHSNVTQERLEELMLSTGTLVKDVGTLLEGADAVSEGLIDEIGGIDSAFRKLYELIDQRKPKTD